MAERLWPSLTFSTHQPPPTPGAPRIMVILNAISKMLSCAFTYESFVISFGWILLCSGRLMHRAIGNAAGAKREGKKINTL